MKKKEIFILISIILLVLILSSYVRFLFALFIISILFPLIITFINFSRFIKAIFFKSKTNIKWQKKFFIFNITTIILGVLLNLLLLSYGTSYDEVGSITYEFKFYYPINLKYAFPLFVFIFIGFASFIILDKKRLKLPPLFFVINLSFLFLCNILMLVFLYQVSNQAFDFQSYDIFYGQTYLVLFPINFFLISFILVKELVSEYCVEISSKDIYRNKILNYLNNIIISSQNWVFLAFIFAIPILIIIMSILILFAQEPDSIIKAFTQTSDWNLSKNVIPPPLENLPNGHYLCTVSLKGHKNIVKPKRVGIRGGEKIVVNRQLMIANAFEEVIQERFPKSHKIIRGIYDEYGFPLSKVITTKLRADITYILMKPLEYIFLIFLYLVDRKPENRIEMQYLPIERKNLCKN